MIINRIDDKYYDSESDFPNYGDWYCLSQDGIIKTYAGDSDATLLPISVPVGCKALSTDGTLYGLNSNQEWEAVK